MNRKPGGWPVAAVLAVLAVVTGFSFFGGQVQALASGAEPAGAPFALHTVKSPSGRDLVARWNGCQDAITYTINLAGIPAGKQAAVGKEIRAGFAKLAEATGMRYAFEGTTSFVPSTRNMTQAPAEIVVAAVSLAGTDLDTDESTLGFGGTVSATWTRGGAEGAAIVRGYAVLDPTSFLALKAGFGAGNTQGNVIFHELGHASGLEHSGAGNIMDDTLSADSPAGFQAGDRAGLAQVGRAAGCVTIPAGAGLADL